MMGRYMEIMQTRLCFVQNVEDCNLDMSGANCHWQVGPRQTWP